MPPKAKKKGGKAKKAKEAAPVSEEQLQHQLLVAEAQRLKDEITRETADINEFQQQRGQLNYFWIVEKKKLEDKRAELRNKERERQDLEEKHQVEIKVYKQRVKHLLYEHQDELTEIKTANEKTLKLEQDASRDAEAELKADRRALKVDLKEMELSHQDYMNALKQEQDKNITLLREEYERKSRDMQAKFNAKMKKVRAELEALRKTEIQRITERKNRHIAELMRSHEKAFQEIKNYYNDITHNNLDLIKSLKEEVAEMKRKEAADEKKMFEVALENKRMSEPLQRALQDVERLRKDLERYQGEKAMLRQTKAELLVAEDRYKRLEWEQEVLAQRFERVKRERDDLHRKFQQTIFTAQQRAGFKNLLLERKLAAVTAALERKEAQLNEVLAQANLETSVLGDVTSRLEDVVETKNQAVRDLQAELERVLQLHGTMMQRYKGKLAEYGVPEEEVGFQPRQDLYPAELLARE